MCLRPVFSNPFGTKSKHAVPPLQYLSLWRQESLIITRVKSGKMEEFWVVHIKGTLPRFTTILVIQRLLCVDICRDTHFSVPSIRFLPRVQGKKVSTQETISMYKITVCVHHNIPSRMLCTDGTIVSRLVWCAVVKDIKGYSKGVASVSCLSGSGEGGIEFLAPWSFFNNTATVGEAPRTFQSAQQV